MVRIIMSSKTYLQDEVDVDEIVREFESGDDYSEFVEESEVMVNRENGSRRRTGRNADFYSRYVQLPRDER